MSEDLYTRWLDIPPGKRPPAPHVLLKVPEDGNDRQQIEDAAHRQLQTLDQHAAHRDPRVREACAQIMNEVACARNLLIGGLARPEPASSAVVSQEDFRKALSLATEQSAAVATVRPKRSHTPAHGSGPNTSDLHARSLKEPSSFNPYHRWLGIPPKDQPPDHYRLLGVERFESNPEVIRTAADRQMAHVRNYQLGEYSKFSQQLLNELAAASVCLLNPQKKARYDEQLRQQFGMQAAPASSPADPIPPPAIASSTPPGGVPKIRADAAKRAAKRNRSRRSFSFIFGLLASVALFGLVGWLAVGGDLPLNEQPPDQVADHETRDVSQDQDNGPPQPSPAEPRTANASPQPSDATPGNLWLDAPTETATVGPVDVRVVSVRLGRPRLVLDTGTEATSSEDALIVTVQLTNTDPTQTIVYSGWGGQAPAPQRLFDNLGTSYRPKTFSHGRIEGQHENVSLDPDEPLHDVLVFERPDENVGFLRLVLAASAFDQAGTIQFEIPIGMVHSEPDQQQAESGLAASQTDGPVAAGGEAAESEPDDRQEQDGQRVETARTPVPDPSEQQEIRRVLDEVYDTTAERDPEEKLELAEQLTDLAEDADDAAERFVLLRRASDLASEGGDAVKMLQLVDRISDEFEVDRLSAQAFMLGRFARQAASADQIRALVVASSFVIEGALDAEQFDLAESLSEAVYRASLAPAGRPFRREALDLRREVQDLRDIWHDVQAAREELESNPDDEVAHTILSGWYYFVRNDWDRALPHFAKGFEPELRQLAERELNSPPGDAGSQVDLADAWWDFAQVDEDTSHPWSARAAYWYEKAWPELTSPLVKAKVRQRLEELGRPDPDRTSQDPDIIPAGQRRLSDLLGDAEEVATEQQRPNETPSRVNDERCRTCNGQGVVTARCQFRNANGYRCRRGTIQDHRYQVVGVNPVTGQRLTQRILVRNRCPGCRGNYIAEETCSDCT